MGAAWIHPVARARQLDDVAAAMGVQLSDAQKRFIAMCDSVRAEGYEPMIVSDRRQRCFIVKRGRPLTPPADAPEK